MKIMLKAVVLLVAFSLLFSAQAFAKEQNVGVAWAGKSGMAKRVLAGFKKGMAEKAPQVKLEVLEQLADIAALAEAAKKFQSGKDAMVILRSNGAKWLGKNPPSIPTFIGGCNNPVLLGAVKNLKAPGGKITGVTYFLPKESQFEVFKAILPNMQSLLLIVNENNPSAAIDVQGTKRVAQAMGLKLEVKSITNTEQAKAVAAAASGKVSAIVLGNQAEVFDATRAIVDSAGKTPVLGYSQKPVKDGALCGFGADDQKLGYMLAQSVADVLLKGKAVGAIPVKTDPEPKFFINIGTAKKLGIEAPYEILESAVAINQ